MTELSMLTVKLIVRRTVKLSVNWLQK